MRRLLAYLRPYWRQVPWRWWPSSPAPPRSSRSRISSRSPSTGTSPPASWPASTGWPRLYLAILVGAFAAEYVQTWTMQLTGQRIMFDLRMAIYGHLQRLDLRYYDRNPVGRLMTRVTSDVDVLNDLFTSGVVTDLRRRVHAGRHHGRDDLDELAAGAGGVRGAAAHRARHAVVPAQRARVVPRGARLDRAHQRVPAGEHHRDVDGAAVPARGAELRRASTRSTASTATRTSSRSSTTRCSIRRSRRSARWRRR